MVAPGRANAADATLDVAWRNKSCRFVVELKSDAKPQTLTLAVAQAKSYAQKSRRAADDHCAYLSGEKLDQLLTEGVSALDFCGNAAVEAPGKFLFYRSGNPNRYRDERPAQSAYRGDGSLVSRVLLLEHQFDAVQAILAAVKQRGGSLTLGTVSKVLKPLESDLIIKRTGRSSVRLIQPDRLLDQLLAAYRPPKVGDVWTGKVAMSSNDLLNKLAAIAGERDLVRTGQSSAAEYAVYAGEPIVECYCRASPTVLLAQLGAEAKETRGFPNLRLIQTEDQRVYFDRRPKLAASPIQAWLEMASGDKRQKEAAEPLKTFLLSPPGANA